MSDEPRLLASGPLPLAGPDFQVTAPLGRVGDGLVYAAREGALPARLREYAPARIVRRLPDGTLHPADPRFAPAWRDASTRFLEKGHRLASLDHPGVAPIWRALAVEADGVRQGIYWVGAPVGEPLAAALDAGLQLAPAAVMALAAHLADTLAALHARGLTHLDISPRTVSLAADRPVLTDFAVDNRLFMPLLESQDGLVRPGYSPIEHHDASMADPLGPPADIYAASALLFRLVTGRDPAPWQERWRDPGAARLADRDDYPPAFTAAIRRGLAIEPDDRFADGAEWQAALALPPPPPPGAEAAAAPLVAEASAPPPARADAAPIITHAPAPPPPPPIGPAPARRRSPVPLLLGLALLAVAVLAVLAYAGRWFVPAEPEAEAPQAEAAPRPAERPQPRTDDDPPVIEPGATVAGRLSAGDRRRGGGQLEDRYVIRGSAGDRLDILLSSGDFDPMVTLDGPGFEAANDDDEVRGTRDSRLPVTLPRDGRYTLAVTSYRRGDGGDYVLQLHTGQPERPARPSVSIVTPAMLAGRWRRADDERCEEPAVITVDGAQLVIRYAGDETRQRILDGIGRTIRTRPADAQGDEETRYRLNDEGDGFTVNDLRWVRC